MTLANFKYISLGKLTYDDAMAYHYHFFDKKAIFIEAPAVFPTDHLSQGTYQNEIYKNSSIYVATHNTEFFNSIHSLFDIVERKNLFKGLKLLIFLIKENFLMIRDIFFYFYI